MAGASADPIDRGWEMLDCGDVDGAERSLAQAKRDTPADPEVLCLEGAIAAARGHIAPALDLLRRAASADPGYAHPLLQASELELYSLRNPDTALELAERASAIAGSPDERVDALLLICEARLYRGERDLAATMDEIDALGTHDPSLLLRAGRIHHFTGGYRAAESVLVRACESAPTMADAFHLLGQVYEARGDREAMIHAWLDTLRLDRAAPPAPWHLSEDQFEAVAEQAMAELPEHVLARLENVPVLIEDFPDEHLVREGYDPRLLGLFSGIPLPDKSHVAGQVPALDSIHLYQRNLERSSMDRRHLLEEIRITVLHETAHFFGLDDDDLHDIGLG